MKLLKNNLNLIFALLVILFSSCEEDEDDYGNQNPNPTPEESASVGLANSDQFGNYLVDAEGRTLYFFAKDATGSSVCEGGCLSAWPAFNMEGTDIGDGLDAADFASINRTDGAKQTTYKGWPLYYFGGDTEAGQINGDGSGEVWFVAKPDYSLMIAEQEVAGQTSKYMTDAAGNTLYIFSKDTKDVSNCTSDGCIQGFPTFFAENLVLPSILSADDFGSITKNETISQTTFRNRALYFASVDEKRGDVNGHNVNEVWFVAATNLDVAPETPTVKLAQSEEFGKYLTDINGNTLYFFTKDATGNSACEGGCAEAFPIFFTESLILGEGLNADDFSSITRNDGSKQTTYKGWPLYFFSGDEEPGQINADDANEVWYVAKPDYVVMLASQDVDGTSETYLVDDRGNTLYQFTLDSPELSACEGGCLDVWPVFTSEADPLVVPSPVNASDFGSFSRAGNVLQLTYRDIQLYFFVQDEARGDINGLSRENFLLINKAIINGEI